MHVGQTSVCFVCLHLPPHDGERQTRNTAWNHVYQQTVFPSDPKTISLHDQVFVLGDLNYRITGRDSQSVRQSVADGQLSSLMLDDELLREMGSDQDRAFHDFTEGAITFAPTYKYDVGTNDFDSSYKNRSPAWTDRVLFRGPGIHQISYASHPHVTASDHKPVTALFQSTVQAPTSSN